MEVGSNGHKNCRILYLVGQLGCGGLERQLYYLLRSLDRTRYRPELVVWGWSPDEIYTSAIEALGVPLHRFHPRASGGIKLLTLSRLVRKLQPEIVHSFSFHTNFAAWWVARSTGSLAVGTVRSDFAEAKRDTGRLLGRLSARWPRDQIFNNRAAADSAESDASMFAPSGIYLVRNGVDLDSFRHVGPSSASSCTVLAVGSLTPVKRWDRLVRIAYELKQSGLDFVVQIAGDGPLRQQLQKQIETLGLCDFVKLLGFRDDVPELLANARFLAHVSDSEGCPNVVAEAMACGRAVVATDCGDVAMLVENDKTGFVVPPHDESALAERIALLVRDAERCTRMGIAARARAEQDLSLDRFVNDTLNVYKRIGWTAVS